MVLNRRALLAAAGATAACATTPPPADIDSLSRRVAGRVILPGDEDYDRERRPVFFNPRSEARPLAIVLCASADDAARTIVLARERDIELAVRAGGHDVQGASSCNGIILDLRLLDAVSVDRDARTVRLGAGLRAGLPSQALAAHGLAAALGCDHRVGVAGLTLGGGLGWLAGRYGAACDNLRGAQLVTADGRTIRTSAEENADLLWALKGGGGNFGVVTELTLDVHPMGNVVQGVVAHDLPRIAAYLRFYRDFIASAGPDLGHELFILPRPHATAFLKVCYVGSESTADHVLAPLLAYGPPLAHTLTPSAYTGSVDPTGEAGARFYAAPAMPRQPDDEPGFLVSGFSAAPLRDAAIDAIAAHLAQAEGGGWSFGCGYTVHGAAVTGPEASAWPREDGQLSFFLGAAWRRTEDAARQMSWIERSRGAIGPLCGPTYVNFITERDPAAVEAAYGANYSRLQKIKRRFDPTNVFHRNRNIRPQGA